MQARRILWTARPKSKGGWLLFAVALFMIGGIIVPMLLNPKGFLLAAAALVSIAAFIQLLPKKAFDLWDGCPYPARGVLVAIIAYGFLVTVGNFSELYSFRLWLDFLIPGRSAPLTLIHATAIAAAAYAYSSQYYDPAKEIPPDSERIIRGPRLIDLPEAKRILAQKFAALDGEPTFFWGGIHHPMSLADGHLLIIGAPSAGKSKSLQLLMESVLPKIKDGSNKRAVIFDAKRDIYSTLRAMGIDDDRMHILNPFDSRGRGWDMAADVTRADRAVEMGTLLVPDKAEVQPFFPEAARNLLGATMEAFLRTAPGRWTLRDVVLTLQSEARTKIILQHAKETRHLVEKYLTSNDTYYSISATLENVMRRLGFVAAAWEASQIKFSFANWIKSEDILVLGNTHTNKSTIQQINAALLHRMWQVLLDQPEAKMVTPTPQTWIILDELRAAGLLPNFAEFSVQARSKGCCIVLGFQDVPGLYAAYRDENLADEIVGSCAYKAFLKIAENRTAKFAEGYFDEQELEITRYNPSWSLTVSQSLGATTRTETEGHNTSKSFHRRPVVSSAELKGLPRSNPANGIHGYYIDPDLGNLPYKAVLPGELVASLVQPLDSVPNFIERPEADMDLREWQRSDLVRLNLLKYVDELLDPAPPQKSKKKKGPIAESL